MGGLETVRTYAIRTIFEGEATEDMFELKLPKRIPITPNESWGSDSFGTVDVYITETGLWVAIPLWSGGVIEMKLSDNKVKVHN
jgi:hypothetical protein